MAAARAQLVLVAALVAALLLAAPHATVAITCGQVNSAVGPCLTYARGGAGPSAACCSGGELSYWITYRASPAPPSASIDVEPNSVYLILVSVC
uniref:Bifunctional inhibitor/plant lipid transfer protein/seed storage helical domain-containing protein n=1 Tax=Leersia perrieri TaxID=77586 RepID=A0A0D9XND5_9ORYZ